MINLSRDLGIDLGTSNVVIFAEGKGIVLREPAVVAIDKEHEKVLQVGAAARNMMGRTPGNIVALHPLQNGVISDYDLTERMMAEFFRKVVRFNFIKPRVIVSVPSGITEVEERAVIQSMMEAGARRVYLIEAPLAAGLGAQLDLEGPGGHLVIDMGGGTTDIAVLTMNGVAESASVKVAGDAFDNAIIRTLRKKGDLIVGKNTAEEIKMTLGGVYPRNDGFTMTVKGRDKKSGRPREVVLTENDVLEAMLPVAKQICDEVLAVLDRTSPELVGDLTKNGVTLTGGCSQIWGFDRLLSEVTGMPVSVADDADSCVAYGCGRAIRWIRQMSEGTANIARKKAMKE